MDPPLAQFIAQLTSAVAQNDAAAVSRLLVVDAAANPHVASLNGIGASDEQLSSLVDKQHFYNDEWLAFNELVVSFVKLARDVNPWSVLESYDLYTTYIGDLAVAFSNNHRGHTLTRLVRAAIAVVLPLTVRLDFQLYYKEDCLQPRLTHLASLLLKMFNNIRSQSGAANDKKTIILLLGYKLCYIYFKLHNPLLCQNIFSNMNNASLAFHAFPMNEQVQYRYYLARFYLIKNQLADAYLHFSWCLGVVSHTPGLVRHPNVTRILRYLLPVAILMGKRPNFAFVAQAYYAGAGPGAGADAAQVPAYVSHYRELYRLVRLGDYNALVAKLAEPAVVAELKAHGLYVIFGQKCLVLLLRNLVKRVWILLGKPSRLDYETIKVALRVATSSTRGQMQMFTLFSNPIEDATVENVLITLVDQNLLKGKLFSNQRSIALAKVNVFPPVDSIYFVRFGNGSEDKLNHTDRWMNS